MPKRLSMKELVDALQSQIDEYVEAHEHMRNACSDLIAENDRLKDTIAELMEMKRK